MGRHDAAPAAGVCSARYRVLPRWLLLASILLVAAPVQAPARSRAPQVAPVVAARQIAHRVAPRESLAAVLERHGVPADEITRWQRAARPVADLRRLTPGHLLQVELDARDRILTLRYDLPGEARLVVAPDARGRLRARREPLPVRTRSVGARVTVGRSIKDSALRAGIPEPVISQLVDLLGWRLDFKEDVHRGDRIRVLWEQRATLDGRLLRPGRIIAVEYEGRAESAAAYAYDAPGEPPTYVDETGARLDGAPLRYPVEFTRITSAFSDARLHPILHRHRPHRGVDFAAPSGTPVRAIGPATVQFAGTKSGYGNHVELDHGDGFVSAYSHLRAIAPAVRPGARIERGELLGWVGRTGLATGPHLHFAIFVDGEYRDPLTISYPPRLGGVPEAAFAQLRTRMTARLRAIPPSSPNAPTAPEVGLPPLALAGGVGPLTLTF